MLSLKLAHLLLLVYWLGADVGTYYASRFVADAQSPAVARTVAARIMLGVDVAPRLCMPLVLATGVHLAVLQGWLAGSAGLITGTWALCLAWLLMVVLVHHHGSSALGKKLANFDFAFRLLLLAALAGAALLALLGAPGWLPAWLAFKLLCFALTVACGLMIRVHLRPFGAAFVLMASGQGSAENRAKSDRVISTSIARCKPYVWLIWGLLVLAAAAGLHLFG
jgi:hypothetical protein